MPIAPVSSSHLEISVTEPVSPALERVKQMLFRPFDLGKWFAIGFCAWLAGLGESGGSFNFNNSFGNGNNNHVGETVQQGVGQIHNFLISNLAWIIPLVAILIIFALAFWLLILWLNSRGKFMFLHCVALNKAEVSEPWHKFKREANSLFLFRLLLGIIGAILMLPVLGIIALFVVRMILAGRPDFSVIMLCIGLGVLLILVSIIFAVVHKFTVDFVVPIMFLRGQSCFQAWKEFFTLLAAHPGKFTLYVLFQIALTMGIGIIVLFAILLTCCILGCLMIIPYIGTVIFLPVLIFKRSYPLYFIRQFGIEYDVFPIEAKPTAPGGLQPPPITPQ